MIETYGDYWKYRKGRKHEIKINKKNGYKYNYDEGKMNLFEDLNGPSRTIVTSEISQSPNRITHLIKQGSTIRNFSPIELERLNMFPDNHTKDSIMTDSRRSFLMGNALVVGIIEKIGKELEKKLHWYYYENNISFCPVIRPVNSVKYWSISIINMINI